MITTKPFEGLIAFKKFIEFYKNGGHKVHPIIYLAVFLTVCFCILLIPALLFIDLCILVYKITENIIKKQDDDMIKSFKKRKGTKK